MNLAQPNHGQMDSELINLSADNDRLRLENARLAAMIHLLNLVMTTSLMDLGLLANHPPIVKGVIEKMKHALSETQSPSTALAEFLGPTIKVLNEFEKFFEGIEEGTRAYHCRCEVNRLTSAAFIKTISS